MPSITLIPLTDPGNTQAVFAALQRQAIVLNLPLRPSPTEPTSCCGRGCNGCVWEGFYTAAMYWQEDALLAIAAVGHRS